MPEITLSLPIALVLLAVLVGLGAGLLFVVLRSTGQVAPEPTATSTPTLTATATLTPTPVTPTPTSTPAPSPTPITYVVQLGDNCITIAVNFGISVNSLVLLNNLVVMSQTEQNTDLELAQRIFNLFVFLCVVAAGLTGLLAVVIKRERSWVLFVSILLLIFATAMNAGPLLHG